LTLLGKIYFFAIQQWSSILSLKSIAGRNKNHQKKRIHNFMILHCSVIFFWDFVRLGLGVDLPMQNNLQDLRVADLVVSFLFFQLWCQFSAATILMKVWQTGHPSILKDSFFINTYTKSRSPGLLFGFDTSSRKIGRQLTSNWCGGVLSQINVPWTNDLLSKDRIRTLLKSVFYPENFIVFNY